MVTNAVANPGPLATVSRLCRLWNDPLPLVCQFRGLCCPIIVQKLQKFGSKALRRVWMPNQLKLLSIILGRFHQEDRIKNGVARITTHAPIFYSRWGLGHAFLEARRIYCHWNCLAYRAVTKRSYKTRTWGYGCQGRSSTHWRPWWEVLSGSYRLGWNWSALACVHNRQFALGQLQSIYQESSSFFTAVLHRESTLVVARYSCWPQSTGYN